MKYFLSLIITFCAISLGQAQSGAPAVKANGKISGSVIDATNSQSVEFATVALTEPNSEKPINGAVCDEKGRFTITKVPNGTYQLIISFIGYENVVVKNIVISDKKDNVDVGPQKLATSSKELEAVVVEGQKVLVGTPGAATSRRWRPAWSAAGRPFAAASASFTATYVPSARKTATATPSADHSASTSAASHVAPAPPGPGTVLPPRAAPTGRRSSPGGPAGARARHIMTSPDRRCTTERIGS